MVPSCFRVRRESNETESESESGEVEAEPETESEAAEAEVEAKVASEDENYACIKAMLGGTVYRLDLETSGPKKLQHPFGILLN